MLIEKIKADLLSARKARNSALSTFLTTIFAEAAAIGKDAGNRATTDIEVVTYLKKIKRKYAEFFDKLSDTDKQKVEFEISIIDQYLPASLTEEQIKSIIDTLKLNGLKLPEIMAHFKNNYAGQYEGSIVSKLAKA